jgi:hypothetical protein
MMVGEELRKLGVGAVYGVDIIPEAAHATHRDRPGVYDGYLTHLTPDQRATLVGADLNTMTGVSALGFAGVARSPKPTTSSPPRAVLRRPQGTAHSRALAHIIRLAFFAAADQDQGL